MNIVENLPKVNGYFLQAHIPEEAFNDWQRELEEASREERINKHVFSLLEDLHNLPAFVKEQQRSDDSRLEQERREWLVAVLRVLKIKDICLSRAFSYIANLK